MTTSFDITDPASTTDHNHCPDYAAISATKCINIMKRKAAETEDKPNHIYTSYMDGISAEAKMRIPSENTIKTKLRNQRSKL